MSNSNANRLTERLDRLPEHLMHVREGIVIDEILRVLPRADEILAGISRPRARRSARRTPNLLLNTSLDENLNALPAARPRPIPRRQDLEAAQRQQNDDFLVRQIRRQIAREEQQASQAKVKADRRADRLQAHRRQEAHLQSAVAKCLEDWKKKSPATFERFQTHQVHAFFAATSAVRVTDILTWFGDMPADAKKALDDLAKYMHVEAALQTDLNSAERAEAFGEGEGAPVLDPEIVHASKMTSINKRGGKPVYRYHSTYGMGKDLASLSKLAPDFTGRGEEKKHVLRIQGAFNIRKTLIETAPADSRFPTVPLHQSIDSQVIKWCRQAIQALASIREGGFVQAYADALPVDIKARCVWIRDQIKTFVEPLEKRIFAYIQMSKLISDKLRPKWNEWKDITDTARESALVIDIAEIAIELERYEKEHGDILPLWRIYLPWADNESDDEEESSADDEQPGGSE
ncbi:hypothetical protein AC579_9118 [Pseudocercospora musae]|uniref:Uncharacterized protein n=1 Tax=Pseudocercospora musae TaxID=113226 RepID=A0A139II99_9PEZI|nr:hypothetical protein AC579_9118 [Pseudocercospora musae]